MEIDTFSIHCDELIGLIWAQLSRYDKMHLRLTSKSVSRSSDMLVTRLSEPLDWMRCTNSASAFERAVDRFPNLRMVVNSFMENSDVRALSKLRQLEKITSPSTSSTYGSSSRFINLPRISPHDRLDLSPLTSCLRLQHLEITMLKPCSLDISPLASCTHLKRLELRDKCVIHSNFSTLATCTALQYLSLRDCYTLAETLELAAFHELRTLHVLHCHLLQTINLSQCSALSELLVCYCPKLERLEAPQNGFPNLEKSNLCGCTAMSDLAFVMDSLMLLSLSCHQTNVRGLQPLEGLLGLKTLNISGCPVSSLSPLSSCLSLTSLSMTGCVLVSDVSPLADLRYLTFLDIRGCELVTDWSVLRHVQNLLFGIAHVDGS
ncbi:hypothetical protein CEUSTIGMA_g9519.t1 [Chlamydomonas eustigma]|uniref:Uncharacterized protein n=1 Tax=Chlamydomonas eustigma TaxID=1157962 RepID=A0A250XG90_9CHLO|nr:hypothetical protein CEUSTIGMA_g9519.t1 [Chlamydomonas eustigma]|eukprot:GAX82091.1 hypothetical protein CEUSTIGMA_g9519.t1 [Chlamydomonas eustigma]